MEELFKGNREWVKENLEKDPEYFKKLAVGQAPEYLWIGCSDSRVPSNTIVKQPAGSIFVHRNIANVVISSDMNLLSVVEYAIKYLKIKKILIVGHYGCGGVKAAISNQNHGFLDNWLSSIKNVYIKHHQELDQLEGNAKENRLVELNAIEQARNLSKISIIQQEWANGSELEIHAIVYDLEDGILHDLEVTLNQNKNIESVFEYKGKD